MLNTSSALYSQIRQALLDCGPFDNPARLRVIFAHPMLKPWRHSILQAGNPAARVDAATALLTGYHADTKENALTLLLRVLSDQLDAADECHHRLTNLADRLEDALRSGSSVQQLIQLAGMTSGELSALKTEAISDIERLVKQDRLKDALMRLAKVEEYKKRAFHLMRQLNNLDKREQLGTVDNDTARAERNNIAWTILGLIFRE